MCTYTEYNYKYASNYTFFENYVILISIRVFILEYTYNYKYLLLNKCREH